MSLIVIGMVGGLTYLWLTRGFFNSLLHMVCVLLAGAIAFAAWEPVSFLLLRVMPSTGTFGFLQGCAWGFGLIVPFALATVVLRLIVDSVVRANVVVSNGVEYAGGAVCGLIASTVAVGVFVLGVGHLPVSSSFLGYQPVWYNDDRAMGVGSLRMKDSLLFPADQLTASLYSSLSTGPFSPGDSRALATWYPELHTVGFASRISPEDGTGRNTLRPADFRLQRSYTVGNPATGTPARELLVDMRSPDVAQPYADLQGEQVTSGFLQGYVIRFEPGAKEQGDRGAGPVSISNGQIRLVVRGEGGETRNVFPLAVISQASAGENVYGRWRYDSEGVHIASVGGASTATMAFEFMLRPGDEPQGLYVKGVRVNLNTFEAPETAYAGVDQRDAVVTDGEILTGGEGATAAYDTSQAVTAAPGDWATLSESMGIAVNVQTIKRFFAVADEGNLVTSGEGRYDQSEVDRRNVQAISRSLISDSFGVARDQRIVQVDVSPNTPASLLGPVTGRISGDLPIRLIDDNGTEYDAVGYIYDDRQIWEARYTPSAPLTGLNDIDAPSLTNSRDDQKLKLLFLVSKFIEVEHLAIGDTVIVSFEPPIDVSR
ncbi:MAG: hypothetical protein ACF8Q5_09695 [Phycisphaerales bacterium JB040]